MHGFAIACTERKIPGVACEQRDRSDGLTDGNDFVGCNVYVSAAALSRHSERAWANISVQHSDLQPETHPQEIVSDVVKATEKAPNSIHINKQRYSNLLRVTAH